MSRLTDYAAAPPTWQEHVEREEAAARSQQAREKAAESCRADEADAYYRDKRRRHPQTAPSQWPSKS
ncbi:MAG: hypothetical protein ABSH44_17180 [Bryobacteraceae bacterium]|jgi:hypothetical protein